MAARRFVSETALYLREVPQRILYTALILTSVALLVGSRVETPMVEKFRSSALDFVTPIVAFVSHPAKSIAQANEEMALFFATFEENERLRREVELLRDWQTAARQLESENADLKALLKYRPDPQLDTLSVRAINDSSGPFVQALLLNAGKRDGLADGQAVSTGDGLVGRIVETGEKASRVLLLTDMSSRVPVLVHGIRVRAILAGDNTSKPQLVFLPPMVQPVPGDVISTSGDGGLFPAGLPVGVIAAGVENGPVRVELFADRERIDRVRVLRYAQPRLVNGPADQADLSSW